MLRTIKCRKCNIKFKTYHPLQFLCSIKCRSESKRNAREFTCIACGKKYFVTKVRFQKTKYCSRSCLAKIHLKQFAKFRFQPTGEPPHIYKQLVTPDGRSMREHRWVMEQAIGRRLTSSEHVHHIDGNPKNNTISNLVILSNSEHQKVHLKERLKTIKEQIPTKII
jgi:hypothetical protein